MSFPNRIEVATTPKAGAVTSQDAKLPSPKTSPSSGRAGVMAFPTITVRLLISMMAAIPAFPIFLL